MPPAPVANGPGAARAVSLFGAALDHERAKGIARKLFDVNLDPCAGLLFIDFVSGDLQLCRSGNCGTCASTLVAGRTGCLAGLILPGISVPLASEDGQSMVLDG